MARKLNLRLRARGPRMAPNYQAIAKAPLDVAASVGLHGKAIAGQSMRSLVVRSVAAALAVGALGGLVVAGAGARVRWADRARR